MTTTKRMAGGIAGTAAAVAALTVLAGGVAPAAAQDTCFNGDPLPGCRLWVVTRMEGVFPVAYTSRDFRTGNYPGARSHYESRPQWEVGLMVNVTPDWAVGGVARLGPGSVDALTGLHLQARRWLTPGLAVDGSVGVDFSRDPTPPFGRLAGLAADVRLDLDDDASFGVRYQHVDLRPFREGVVSDAGGTQRALSLVVGAGSEWGIAATAATGLWAVFLAWALHPA